MMSSPEDTSPAVGGISARGPSVQVIGTDLVITVDGGALARMLGEHWFRSSIPDDVADPARFAQRVAAVLTEELEDGDTRLDEFLYTAAVYAVEEFDRSSSAHADQVALVSSDLRGALTKAMARELPADPAREGEGD